MPNIVSPAEADFWLDTDKYSNYFEIDLQDSTKKELVFSIDMVRLASIRRAISNFVKILTRQPIPVYFNDVDSNVNFGGKLIYISAEINTKSDFDVAVGQALHEGAHTIKTDFDVVKSAYVNIPHKILKISDAKNIRRASIEKFIKNIWNVIEDRYIDNYVFNSAPGYRGYYVALYNKFWNNPKIDEYLLSDMFKYPSLDSYSFRITNFTNENTDLLALPKLDEIADIIDISNIERLETTKDRIETAFRVVEVVLDCLEKFDPKNFAVSKSNLPKFIKPEDFFDFGDEITTEDGENFNDSGSKEDVDVGKKIIIEISDVINGKTSDPENQSENKDIVDKISDKELDSQEQKDVKKTLESQRKFLQGEFPKKELTSEEKELLDLIEKHGVILVKVKLPKILVGDEKNLKVDCIVVQKMTKELILSGSNVFPLCGVMEMDYKTPSPPAEVADAVKKGIQIGTKLGRKLQVRNEINPTKLIRKKFGKLNKRLLHEAAFDSDTLFHKTFVEQHNKAVLHISVDASGSMQGKKWIKTMTAVVAICKAASMVDNIHVTVSFRSTQESGRRSLPYVILAYNSKVDKFSKIKQLFPYLLPNGCTPEGLAFDATMNLFENITPDEKDRYFLNLSDGEPYYSLILPTTTINYSDEVGVNHTKAQVDKIKKHGVEILSYFIDDYGVDDKKTNCETELHENFKKMYGQAAKFIGVNDVVALAKTLNEMFLKKSVNK